MTALRKKIDKQGPRYDLFTPEHIAAYIKRQCSTPRRTRAYFAKIGLKRLKDGTLTVTPL